MSGSDQSAWPPPGDRAGRARAQAVPVPRRAGQPSATRPSTSTWPRSARVAPHPRSTSIATCAGTGCPRAKVLATVVKLLEETSIRIGNDEYARDNRLVRADDHARPTMPTSQGNTVRFEFKGKSGKVHSVELDDRRMARDRQTVSRPAGPGVVPVRRRRRPAARHRVGRRQRVHEGDQRRRLHGQGLSDVERHGAGRALPASCASGRPRQPRASGWCRAPSRTSRGSWGTRPRCAVGPTFIRSS